MSSAGKSPVSAPASTAMFDTASRSSIVSDEAPSPTNSSAMFVAPPTPISAIRARMRSLPATNPRFSPASSTTIVPGTICQNVPIAMQPAMSVAPIPVPKAPSAPYVHVWESDPATTEPGTIQPSSTSTVCSMPPRPWS